MPGITEVHLRYVGVLPSDFSFKQKKARSCQVLSSCLQETLSLVVLSSRLADWGPGWCGAKQRAGSGCVPHGARRFLELTLVPPPVRRGFPLVMVESDLAPEIRK